MSSPAAAQCYPGLACPPSVEPLPPAPVPASPPASAAPEKAPAAASAPANGGRSYWTHNGSLVSLAAEGNTRSFFYERPREGMQAYGAEKGALLFKGAREGEAYSGTAYVFAGRCGAIPYAVRGIVSHDNRRVTMTGQAPSQVNAQCQVTSYRPDTLVFDFSH